MNDDTHRQGIKKETAGKLRMDLIPYDAVQEITKAFSAGGIKYGEGNWACDGGSYKLYHAAIMRHMTSWVLKENDGFDEETKLNHLAHAAASAMILLAYELRGIGTDDRPYIRKKSIKK